MAITINATRAAYHKVIAGEIGRVDPTGARYWALVMPAWVGAAFCVAGLQWALRRLGLPMVPAPSPFYCPSVEAYARNKGAWVSQWGAAMPGDWVLFDFIGKGYATHIGYLERVNSDGTVTCIEFNTSSGSSGSQANGRGVWRRTRSRSLVRGFVRLSYKAAPKPAPKPAPAKPAPGAVRTLSRGMTGSDVKALQTGLLRAFPAYAGPIKAGGGPNTSFGPATEKVVKEFQRRAIKDKLYSGAIDGIVGAGTRSALARCGIRWW